MKLEDGLENHDIARLVTITTQFTVYETEEEAADDEISHEIICAGVIQQLALKEYSTDVEDPEDYESDS